ncbi:MAG: DUF6249 domain-containing protein [Bacteroidales bacterium]|jgi:uncharacterized protein YneF (UPF0154 family)
MDEITGIIAILSAVALPLSLGFVIGLKALSARHQERLLMIEKGIDINKKPKKPNRYMSLQNAIILLSIGIGLIIAFIIARNYDFGKYEFLFFVTLIVVCLGIGFLINFFIMKKIIKENAFIEEE